MSRGQLARTPENFPLMNDRAGRRRKRRAWQLLAREGNGDPLVGFCTLLEQLVDTAFAVFENFVEVIAGAFTSKKRDDYALVPASHAPMAAPPMPLRNDALWNTCPHGYIAEACTGPDDAHEGDADD
ncbi:hypothetical protein [Pseudoclavibacter sp. AY1H1]|uniref:hypothetical protein n=1 Tax=Pseudoclavibacter sp. AY1H1 TaxID=2080584 RepID=UPI000CE83107|nr:hypothetical protein [Pseudoclavibacter sp. AY1H1]PPF39955.1 hypothetical protein C5E05_01715 [Pseudoclavibacter sp. AY1H1]